MFTLWSRQGLLSRKGNRDSMTGSIKDKKKGQEEGWREGGEEGRREGGWFVYGGLNSVSFYQYYLEVLHKVSEIRRSWFMQKTRSPQRVTSISSYPTGWAHLL